VVESFFLDTVLYEEDDEPKMMRQDVHKDIHIFDRKGIRTTPLCDDCAGREHIMPISGRKASSGFDLLLPLGRVSVALLGRGEQENACYDVADDANRDEYDTNGKLDTQIVVSL
tara:strand:+ start:2431 stop:2772 length:342 start_codon:yes stop_codon:yes gene_type:complete